MTRLLVLLVISLIFSGLFVACQQEQERRETPQEANADECVEDAFRAAKLLGTTLKTRLVQAMEQSVEHAVRVCADEAQAIHQRVANQTGVRLGRTSTKLRNTSNGQAPAWVVEHLGRRDLEPSKVREGREARAIIPLTTMGLCLNCHGEVLSDEVRSVLDDHYPEDRATGYATGEIRGVIWAAKTCSLR